MVDLKLLRVDAYRNIGVYHLIQSGFKASLYRRKEFIVNPKRNRKIKEINCSFRIFLMSKIRFMTR